MKLFTVWLWLISFVWIAHRNHTEWVWNPFICDIAHINVIAIITVTPYEQYHWHLHNPFFYRSRIHKTHHVNEPLICILLLALFSLFRFTRTTRVRTWTGSWSTLCWPRLTTVAATLYPATPGSLGRTRLSVWKTEKVL